VFSLSYGLNLLILFRWISYYRGLNKIFKELNIKTTVMDIYIQYIYIYIYVHRENIHYFVLSLAPSIGPNKIRIVILEREQSQLVPKFFLE
jgi:hypothetical protein